MATYYDNFSGHTSGSAPSGWTEDTLDSGHHTWTVQTSGGIKYLRGTTDGTLTSYSNNAIRLNSLQSDANRANFEQLVCFSWNVTPADDDWMLYGNATGAIGGAGNPYTQTWYYQFATPNQAYAYVSGYTDNATAVTGLSTIVANTRYWMRYKVSGYVVSMKVWADGSSEPGSWTSSYTSADTFVAGGLGIATYNTPTSKALNIHLYSAATNTDVAATPLIVQDSTHGHSAGNITLVPVHMLSPNNTVHSHTAGNVALTQKHTLVVQNAVHAHTAGSIVLIPSSILLTNNAVHAHTARTINLDMPVETQFFGGYGGSYWAGTYYGSAGATAPLVILTVSNCIHGHTVGNVVLTQKHTLTLASTRHLHSVTSPTLTQKHILATQSCLHVHTADRVTLIVYYPEGDYDTGYYESRRVKSNEYELATIDSPGSWDVP